jgi:hypothetical protein
VAAGSVAVGYVAAWSAAVDFAAAAALFEAERADFMAQPQAADLVVAADAVNLT